MESGRHNFESAVEVNGTNKNLVATYKTLPDGDSNWQGKIDDKNHSMVKSSEEKREIDDGAKEKMLNEQMKITPVKDASEVIFMTENGDAKIDSKHTLSGMGKEELMKFANDPFWVRTRWFLFIAFWLLWLAMLAGAVAIIVMAPKCTAPVPKKWWEKSPIVQLEPLDIKTKDLIAFKTLCKNLKTHGISIISLSSILRENGTNQVIDFKDSQIGINKTIEFIQVAKAEQLKVVLEFDPNHSGQYHDWFIRSINREGNYTDYYVWADGKNDTNNSIKPPNNWLSLDGGSAWEWNEQRKQYYLHQFKKTQPDFNFHNPKVVKAFSEIFAHWIKLGVNGFRLGNTRFLMENPSRLDEERSYDPANPEDYQYQSLNHVHTKDREENGKILREWRDIVANMTNNDGLFALKDDIGADILAVFNEKKTLIDLPQRSAFFASAHADISAESLETGISQSRSVPWPGWDLTGNQMSMKDRMGNSVAESIFLMTLLLPGTPIFKLKDIETSPKAFSDLASKRTEDTFLYGNFKTYSINKTVFAYTRFKSGFPGYLVAYQSSEKSSIIDVSSLLVESSEVNVFAHSSNYDRNSTLFKDKMSPREIPISPKSTLVLTFVAKG